MSERRVFLIPFLLALVFLSMSIKTTLAAGIDDLIYAVWGFEVEKAAQIIDSGVDVNSADANGTYPLLLACSYKDNDEMIEMLLKKGADPNVRGPQGETPLAFAARYSLKAVQMLLDKGAQINARDDAGHTALWWAMKMENPEIVRFLKENGAE